LPQNLQGRPELFRFRAFASLPEHFAPPAVFSHIARAAQNSGQLGGDPYHGHAPESAWSASARMHSPATILSKLSNRKAKSQHSTLREYQHNNGAQIRNADDIH
jgi:hypothetical protein